MADTFPNRLRQVRRSQIPKLSQEKLGVAAGFTQSQISMWENYERPLTDQRDIRRLAEALSCAPEDIVGESSAERNQVPIVGLVGAGSEIYPIDEGAKGSRIGQVDCPSSLNPAKAIALEVRGDSMYPLLAEGDLLFYQKDRIPGVPAEYMDKICIVEIEDGKTLVKRVTRGGAPGRFNLVSLNPATPVIPNAMVNWSAVVEVMVPIH